MVDKHLLFIMHFQVKLLMENVTNLRTFWKHSCIPLHCRKENLCRLRWWQYKVVGLEVWDSRTQYNG